MARTWHVAVAGALGKLGSVADAAFSNQDEFHYLGGLARHADPEECIFDSFEELKKYGPEILVDCTTLPDSFDISMEAVRSGCRVVIGTSGWSDEQRAALTAEVERIGNAALFVPNFSIGAVLMMRFAREAAKFLPAAEIIEMHRVEKKDKPSGTAKATAREIVAGGGNEPAIHSVRLPGAVAHQEVLFGGTGELLTIRHDSLSFQSFVPGILMAARAVTTFEGVRTGLEWLL